MYQQNGIINLLNFTTMAKQIKITKFEKLTGVTFQEFLNNSIEFTFYLIVLLGILSIVSILDK